MNSAQREIEKQASAIALDFFWRVAGRHQACMEQLQKTVGTVPDAVWWSLCFEPLVFGLSFFGEYVQNRFTAPERDWFAAELETATRWLLATTLFAPNGVVSLQPQTPASGRIGSPSQSRWALSQGHERALAPFSRWCEARQEQFKKSTNLQADSNKVFAELKTDIARDGFCCSDTVLHVFAEGVVGDAYRIRSEVLHDLPLMQLRIETSLPLSRAG